jgi:cytochrome c-type biogenesis protein CcmH
MKMKILTLLVLIATAALFLTAPDIAANAQGDQPKTITADQVNAIASKLYCPVCENITLDTCGTAACAQWRDEIRLQLEEGKTPQQVIDDFVTRFGDRVVGTPVDPTLRALSLVTPWVLGVLAIFAAVWYLRQRNHTPEVASSVTQPTPTLQTDDDYLARLEHDLAKMR